MINPIETLKKALTFKGGYVLIPEKLREKFCMHTTSGFSKDVTIKSILCVCVNPSSPSVVIRVMVMDEDDTMWDVEDFLTTDKLKDLVVICGCF